jgi:hypothetical protein
MKQKGSCGGGWMYNQGRPGDQDGDIGQIGELTRRDNFVRQITATGWLWRLASSAAVVFAFLFALDHPLRAQANLIVSDHGTSNAASSGAVRFFQGTNLIGSTPGFGGEGEACLAGETYEIFSSNTSDQISTSSANLTTGVLTPISMFPAVAAASFAGLSLNGSTLYAAGGNGIYAFNTLSTSGAPIVSAEPGLHDVVYDPQNSVVYATASGGPSVYAYEFNGTTFTGPTSANAIALPSLPPLGTYGFEGLAVDPSGNLFVSNFHTVNTTSQPGVYEYSPAANANCLNPPVGVGCTTFTLAHEFFSMLFNAPLGLAVGPNGNVYVANFGSLDDGVIPGVLQINLSGLTTLPIDVPNNVSPYIIKAGVRPKYLQFVQSCAPTGTIEICKLSSTINPVPPGGVYGFNVTGAANTVTVPVGECSGPIYVAPPATKITELPTPGVAVYTITTDGYSPPPLSQQEGNAFLLESDTQTGMSTVVVQASLETIVTFTNYDAPNAQLKLCKIAGASAGFAVTPGTPFNFTAVGVTNAGSGYTSIPAVTITGGGCTTPPMATATIANDQVTGITLTSPGSGCSTSPPLVVTIGAPGTGATATAAVLSVEAGPEAEGGYCQVVSGTFEVGTSATVTESVPGGYSAPTVTVNGAYQAAVCPQPPAPGPTNPAMSCGVAAVIGPGINEVSFTDQCAALNGPGCVSQIQPGQGSLPNLDIVSYSLVSQVAVTGTQSYMTYRADLLNTGKTTMGPIVATLTSLDPSGVRVVGQGALNFASAPPKSPVASSNTFTVLTNPAVPLDFSRLSWTYQSRRSIRPVHLKPVAVTPFR